MEEIMKLITKEIEENSKQFPLYSQDGKGGNVASQIFSTIYAGTAITEGIKLW